eukprot:CAMPEP_0197568442 /NCGR_PEP_ID=MMETSP1320-20131121/37322_1 /TAXON_ID=91990 /ORGANISM="Bolidomonas sp., Strain RCC2347" /LENGTH=420 /DNA_ID=CAMNT_0043130717 /DNA_START=71 /DNA_END=1330 /DNA_ORIENTATION=+
MKHSKVAPSQPTTPSSVTQSTTSMSLSSCSDVSTSESAHGTGIYGKTSMLGHVPVTAPKIPNKPDESKTPTCISPVQSPMKLEENTTPRIPSFHPIETKRKKKKMQISRSSVSSALLSPRGMLLIAEFKAMLSVIDMISDIIMIFRYKAQGNDSFALASLLCVLLNLVGQSALVFLANRNLPTWRQIREQGIVWTCTKPGFDAYRVSISRKREVGTIFDARVEQTARKVIELVFECLPGTFVQTLAIFVKGGDRSFIPLASLGLSVLTSAFISTDMSYGWDVNSDNRHNSPSFYGYLPSRMRGRILSTFLIFSVSTFNLSIRSLIYVILWLRGGPSYVVLAIAAEHALYFFVKSSRNDLWYWIPVYGCLGIMKSIIARFVIKVVADFTACVQFRHPNEVGGLYWSMTLLLTAVAGLGVAE